VYGSVPPSTFISLAEDLGLIGALGERVLRAACRDVARLRHGPIPDAYVAVNLSVRQLGEASFPLLVEDAVRAYDLPYESLCLEVTESLLMTDPDRCRVIMRELQGKGVRIAVDDFGTGYSSLASLRCFNLDYVKIDRSFIVGLGSDPTAEAIVGGV